MSDHPVFVWFVTVGGYVAINKRNLSFGYEKDGEYCWVSDGNQVWPVCCSYTELVDRVEKATHGQVLGD